MAKTITVGDGGDGRNPRAATGKSWAQKTIGVALPFLDRYSPLTEAISLEKDAEIIRGGYSREKIVGALEQGYEVYKQLYRFAQVADSADKLTSLVGAPLEVILSALGVAPGVVANLGEELVEMLFKAPFYVQLLARHNELPLAMQLGLLEAGTIALPVGGDIVDFGTNLYMAAAYKLIRESAKRTLMEPSRTI